MRKNNYELVDRFILHEVPRPGIWLSLKIANVRYSVLNVGKLMENAPYKYDGFSGWESLDSKNNIIRANSLEELILILLKEDSNS